LTFFNKKTEVINLELTPIGRHLLSQGKLKPKFYTFSDEDILYDASYGGISTENQNSAHNRITNETPKLKNILIRTGVESNFRVSETTAQKMDRLENTKLTYDQKYLNSLGVSEYGSLNVPYFQVHMLQGEISSSLGHFSSSVVQNLQIPQVDINFNINMSTGSVINDSPNNYQFTTKVFPDGKFVILDFDDLYIHLKEFNSFYQKENFEIEVFQFTTEKLINNQTIDKIVPLFFKNGTNAINNGIYQEPVAEGEELAYFNDDSGGDSLFPIDKDVTYYFEIEVDNEISNEELCQVVDSLKSNNQFLDDELICPDQRTERFDIYNTRVLPGDLEDCD